MAEILTLVLFALLLALAYAFTEQERVIAERDRVIADLQQRVDAYAEKAGVDGAALAVAERIEQLRQKQAPERDPLDYFTELVAGLEEMQRLQAAVAESDARRQEAEVASAAAVQEAARLASELKVLAKERNELRSALSEAGRTEQHAVKAAVERAGFSGATPRAIEEALKSVRVLDDAAAGSSRDEVIGTLSELTEAAKQAGKSTAEWMRDAKSAAVELNDAHGAIESLKRQIGGTPGVLPPCWSDEARKPEYVFDVRLASKGIEPRLRPLPYRRQQLIELLGTDEVDGGVMPDARFAALTRNMYEWSVAHECRFYVVVYDGTAPEEKAIYKARLRTVEGHFYKRFADESEGW